MRPIRKTQKPLEDITLGELLQFFLAHDMIDDKDEAAGKTAIMGKQRRDLILKAHAYAVWQGTNTYWYTHLPDPDRENGRRKIRRKTKESLEDAIVAHYKKAIDDPSVEDIFFEWAVRKKERGEITRQTYERYVRDFEKFYLPIQKKPVRSLTEYDIEDFVISTIYENKLTNKAYSNMRTLLFGIFRLAKKKGIIGYSITDLAHDFDISKKAFAKEERPKEKEVLNDKELSRLRGYLNRESADVIDLGLYLDTLSGLRIGELAAVKIRDVDLKTGIIHVSRTEVSYYDSEQKRRIYTVRDSAKTDAGTRDIYLSKAGKAVLSRIRRLNPFGEYLLEKNGKRILTYQIRQRLYHACDTAGIPRKPPHALRRTYASILIDAGVNASFVASQMGHTRIETTLGHYYKDRMTDADKEMLIGTVKGL